MLTFALVNWGFSSALIGAYFVGRIEKNHDSSQVIMFSKTFGSFQCFEECQHKCHSNFLLFRSEESRHHLRTHFIHAEIIMYNLSNTFLASFN